MTETSLGSWSRSRQISSVLLAVLAGLLFGSAFLVVWVERTLFDADHFSRRAVLALESEAVRHAVAVELTDELASRGNQAVLAARPAAIAVVEALINTDAFQSIFADATRAAHESLLVGEGVTGLDLSASLSLLASGLELREMQASSAGAADGPGTFPTLVERVAASPLWERVDQVRAVARVLVPLGVISAVASIALAIDRRRAVRRIGLGLFASGAFVIGLVALASWAVTVPVDSEPLSDAAEALVWATTADLRSAAFSAVLVGIVVMAATTRDEFTLRSAGERLSARVRTLRATTPGTLVLAAVAGFVGVTTMVQPAAMTRLLVSAGALGLVFTAVRLAMDALGARRSVPGEQAAGVARSRVPTWAAALLLIIPLVAIYAVVTIDSAGAAAEPELERSCQGSPDRCALRLDEVTFPGTHNSMSAAQYPGYLFAEQTAPIGQQLRSGVRALLIDTHYGIPSSATMPGADVPLILTDRAAALAVPGAEVSDTLRVEAERASADAVAAPGARRSIYLCHNHCELGAVPLVNELRTLRDFLRRNPSEVIVLIIQDATASTDVAQVFDEAGLTAEAAVLDRSEPLPTLGDLVDAGTQLLVFAERSDADAPAWYHSAFEWFQETRFGFSSVDDFDCAPNRGSSDNPLLLVNHWVSRSPADPDVARQANTAKVLQQRVATCAEDRSMRPNVLAVDFSSVGDLFEVTDQLLDEAVDAKDGDDD